MSPFNFKSCSFFIVLSFFILVFHISFINYITHNPHALYFLFVSGRASQTLNGFFPWKNLILKLSVSCVGYSRYRRLSFIIVISQSHNSFKVCVCVCVSMASKKLRRTGVSADLCERLKRHQVETCQVREFRPLTQTSILFYCTIDHLLEESS